MAGAHAVQMVSALLRRRPAYLAACAQDAIAWLDEHEYDSLRQMQRQHEPGSAAPTPRSFERANYMRMLQSWKAV